jgi:hypothetical protein
MSRRLHDHHLQLLCVVLNFSFVSIFGWDIWLVFTYTNNNMYMNMVNMQGSCQKTSNHVSNRYTWINDMCVIISNVHELMFYQRWQSIANQKSTMCTEVKGSTTIQGYKKQHCEAHSHPQWTTHMNSLVYVLIEGRWIKIHTMEHAYS